MKRVAKWTAAVLIQAVVMFGCYHMGFQDGYSAATGYQTTETAATKIICHGSGCGQLGLVNSDLVNN